MSMINGTDGNDMLTGGAANDTITPGLGVDTVDGGGGIDRLIVDYGTTAGTGTTSTITSDSSGGFGGIFYADDGTSSTSFSNIEHVQFTAGGGDDTLIVDADSLASSGRTLQLDGGDGTDRLSLDLSGLSGNTGFVVNGANVTSNRGTFSHWENFDLALGGATDTVTLGHGDDNVTSNGGVDTIDLGAGNNTWTGNYATATTGLSFGYEGTNATLSNGTSVSNVQAATLTTGSGDDSFALGSQNAAINAGAGNDTLSLDFTGSSANSASNAPGNVFVNATMANGSFSGSARDYTSAQLQGEAPPAVKNEAAPALTIYPGENLTTFGGIETLEFTGSIGYDYFSVGGIDPTLLQSGAMRIVADGGGDSIDTYGDGLTLQFLSTAPGQTIDASSGSFAIGSSSFSNFSRFLFEMGNSDDAVTGGGGNDTMYGYGGNDTLSGGDGGDSLYGGLGDDVLNGGDGDDYIEGDTGNNMLNGGAGNDTITYYFQPAAVTVSLAATGAQAVNAGTTDTLSGIENIVGSQYNDTLTGDAGDNSLDGEGGADMMTGGAGNDFYSIDNVGDVAVEQANGGIDTIFDYFAYTSYTLGDNFENLELATYSNATGIGNAADNMITGGAYDDTLEGLAGNDTLDGGYGGNDTLDGGAGTDTASFASLFSFGAATGVTVSLAVTGAQDTGAGGTETLISIENLTGSDLNDTLTGDANANTLTGGLGDDHLRGGAGSDNLSGGLGNDSLNGDGGFNRAIFAGATAGVTVDLNLTAAQDTGQGMDTLLNIQAVLGSDFNDTLTGDAKNNELKGGIGNDTLVGGGGNDQLNGGAGTDTADYSSAGVGVHVDLSNAAAQNTQVGSDTLTSIENLLGGAFNDVLTGSSVANVLSGGAGIDKLDGGLGKDILTGGAGNDKFYFTTTLGSANIDTITDFTAGQDKMFLDHNVFAGLTAGALAAGAYDTGAAASDADDRIIYNSATGALLFDRDGNGSAYAAVQFATLSTGLTTLSASSFQVA